MPKRIVSPNAEHKWIVGTYMPLTIKQAAHAATRLSLPVTDARFLVDPLALYCAACGRSYDDVADQPCADAESNLHRIGGPTGKRKRRKKDHDDDPEGAVTPRR